MGGRGDSDEREKEKEEKREEGEDRAMRKGTFPHGYAGRDFHVVSACLVRSRAWGGGGGGHVRGLRAGREGGEGGQAVLVVAPTSV